jgi:SAM-dependent methyltransferase
VALLVPYFQNRLYPCERSRSTVPRFREMLERYLTPSSDVLDIGAGAGTLNAYAIKGHVRSMVGVDLDPRVEQNPLLDKGVVGDVYKLPFPDGSFDVAFAIYVLEHIQHPERFVQEVRRILRPKGVFLFLTPNRYHYVSLISALTPTGFHKWVNRRRGLPNEDTFETHYKMNTRGSIQQAFASAGFSIEELQMIEVQPNYLKFSAPSFLLGAMYERLVNSAEWLSWARVNILGVVRRPPQ